MTSTKHVPGWRDAASSAIAVLVASAAIVAHAPDAHGDERPEMVEAKRRMGAGAAFVQRGKYEEARVQYAQACAIVQSQKCNFSLSVVQLKTGHPLEAYQLMQGVLADGAFMASLDAGFLKTAEATRAAAFAQTGHLVVQAPAGARVLVDDVDVGGAPFSKPLDVTAGGHTLEARTERERGATHVDATAGVETPVTLAFDTRPLGVAPLPGASPLTPAPLPPSPNAASTPYWNGRRSAGAVVAGVGVVGLALGGVFGGERAGETSDANAAHGRVGGGPSACSAPSASKASACSAERNAYESRQTDAHWEEGLLIGGGVLVAVGLATTFWPRASGSSTVTVSPAIGPQTAGIRWAGTF